MQVKGEWTIGRAGNFLELYWSTGCSHQIARPYRLSNLGKLHIWSQQSSGIYSVMTEDMSSMFINFLEPTDTERTIFELEFGIPYPDDELLKELAI